MYAAFGKDSIGGSSLSRSFRDIFVSFYFQLAFLILLSINCTRLNCRLFFLFHLDCVQSRCSGQFIQIILCTIIFDFFLFIDLTRPSQFLDRQICLLGEICILLLGQLKALVSSETFGILLMLLFLLFLL